MTNLYWQLIVATTEDVATSYVLPFPFLSHFLGLIIWICLGPWQGKLECRKWAKISWQGNSNGQWILTIDYCSHWLLQPLRTLPANQGFVNCSKNIWNRVCTKDKNYVHCMCANLKQNKRQHYPIFGSRSSTRNILSSTNYLQNEYAVCYSNIKAC